MARRRRGKPINGWLVVDKPAGMTSTAVVNAVRRALDAQKAGHAGTLDPMATGVLAIALGDATKTVPYVTEALKCYRFTVRLGQATDTDDAEGAVIGQSDTRPDDQAIAEALAPFRGEIQQIPPAYSAVKVAGQRAYDLARDGQVLELAARDLWVESLEMVARPDPDHVELEMVCGKGGYVRSIARDLGQALGCLGHVSALRRVWSGPFDADAGASMADIEAGAEALMPRILPLETGLADLPELPASAEGAARLRNGNPGLVLASDVEFGEEAWASWQGRAVAVGIYKAGELHPTRVLGGRG